MLWSKLFSSLGLITLQKTSDEIRCIVFNILKVIIGKTFSSLEVTQSNWVVKAEKLFYEVHANKKCLLLEINEEL